MGVPSFYRWLVDKYPKAVVKAIEEKGEAVDTSLKNPNGLEFDHLYLDMNGIIHPCFHPDHHPPTTFEEVFNNVYEYIDRLFSIVRPRKLLYLAIDGVAPRAKMNQQRTRRFRTSKDNEIAEAEEKRLRKEFEMAGKPVFPNLESEVSDSNIITPGTVFMDKLSKALKSYVNQRIESDAGWKEIKVILSDANVPGEGEHKIMSFIRLQRTSPNYDPNTRHCLYGQDADLIMLALATHEVHFSILREDILTQEQQPECQSALENSLSNAEPSPLRGGGAFKPFRSPSSLIRKPYQFLHIWILREYLELDLKISNPPEKVNIDLDRLIDDFIFMCFCTGNDFLPHMPTLEIHEGAIDLLMHVYKEEFKNFGGYLIDMQWAEDKKARYVKLKRVEKFILAVGAYEEKIFKKRSEIRQYKVRRLLSQYSNQPGEEQEEEQGPDVEIVHCASANGNALTFKNVGTETVENSESTNGTTNSTGYISEEEILQNTKELIKKLNSFVRNRSDLFKSGSFAVDKVKLGAVGWKERYYKEKFSAGSKEDLESTRKAVVEKYTEGLCWVILYYFSGVPSWTWFYPFHYGIFASDFRGISQVKMNFQKGSPFKPFNQLMGVLPPRSAHALPRAYQALMTSKESNIIDFYPPDFQVDEEGKRFLYQAICKLPFIDVERLLSETKKLEVELSDDESIRNETKVDVLFVRSSNKLGSQIFSLHRKQLAGRQTEMLKESIDTNLNCGISGCISPSDEVLNTIIFAGSKPWEDYEDVSQQNNVLCALYELPNSYQHIPRPLEGVHFPEKTISEDDIVERQLWHEYGGSRPNNRLRNQEFCRNETTEAKPSLTKSSFGVTYEGTGFEWSSTAGKGKQNNYTSDLYFQRESSTRFAFGHGQKITFSSSSSVRQLRAPSSSWDSPHHGTYRGTFNLHDKWKSSSSGQVNTEAIESLRISDSRQGFSSIGRAESVNTNFRPYRNSAVSDRNYEWRQSEQPLAATPNGRGFDRLLSHTWWHNQSLAANRDYEWRQSVQPPTATPYGRGFARLPSHTWRHNQSPAANRDYEWRQSVQPPAANPPMPVHGRGWSMPKASATNWHSPDTPRTSDTERYPRRKPKKTD
ncbi:5'-3' exoribonuclease 4-like isoform X1 [Actinidia eriantha]|uniref:5'-3' exoribonuclease 4-like isoform X1 n=1 Tax=Actinidia eriantha TaxID=165200 RepID=UPI00258D2956|nr:5'-3' exoribonuclease 4-like isoform X1 [Actinidia eriantha]